MRKEHGPWGSRRMYHFLLTVGEHILFTISIIRQNGNLVGSLNGKCRVYEVQTRRRSRFGITRHCPLHHMHHHAFYSPHLSSD